MRVYVFTCPCPCVYDSVYECEPSIYKFIKKKKTSFCESEKMANEEEEEEE